MGGHFGDVGFCVLAASGDFEYSDGSDAPFICTLFAYIGSCHNLVVVCSHVRNIIIII